MKYVDPSGHCFTLLGEESCAQFVSWLSNVTDTVLEWENEHIGFIQPTASTVQYLAPGVGSGVRYLGARLLAGANNTKLAINVVSAGEDVWKLGWSQRGFKIDNLLGNNLGSTFKTVDRFDNGVLTSIKSYDLVNSYQKSGAWLSQLKTDIRSLSNFTSATGRTADGVEFRIDSSMVNSRVLHIAIPDVSLTGTRLDEYQKAVEYAKELGITLITTVVRE